MVELHLVTLVERARRDLGNPDQSTINLFYKNVHTVDIWAGTKVVFNVLQIRTQESSSHVQLNLRGNTYAEKSENITALREENYLYTIGKFLALWLCRILFGTTYDSFINLGQLFIFRNHV